MVNYTVLLLTLFFTTSRRPLFTGVSYATDSDRERSCSSHVDPLLKPANNVSGHDVKHSSQLWDQVLNTVVGGYCYEAAAAVRLERRQ